MPCQAHPNKSDRVDEDQPKGASAAGEVERSAGSLGGRHLSGEGNESRLPPGVINQEFVKAWLGHG